MEWEKGHEREMARRRSLMDVPLGIESTVRVKELGLVPGYDPQAAITLSLALTRHREQDGH